MRPPILDFLDAIPSVCAVACDPAATGCVKSLFIGPSDILDAARAMLDAGYFLEDVSAVDVKEGYHVAYHFDHWDRPGRIVLRVLAPFADPVVASIASVYQGAEWHEREAMDMVGVRFANNPNPAPLLLTDDMADLKPLRREDKDRAPLLSMLPFVKPEAFPPGHPLAGQEPEEAPAEPAPAAPRSEE